MGWLYHFHSSPWLRQMFEKNMICIKFERLDWADHSIRLAMTTQLYSFRNEGEQEILDFLWVLNFLRNRTNRSKNTTDFFFCTIIICTRELAGRSIIGFFPNPKKSRKNASCLVIWQSKWFSLERPFLELSLHVFDNLLFSIIPAFIKNDLLITPI